MVKAYRVGAISSDTGVVRNAYPLAELSTTRTKLQEKGADFVVGAGKTFYVGLLYCINIDVDYDRWVALMYDDDGAGTNEVEVYRINLGEGQYPTSNQILAPVCIAIPAGKYLTAKGQSGGQWLTVSGIEIPD